MINVTITGETPAAVGKQLSELAATFTGAAKPAAVAAPAASPAKPAPAAVAASAKPAPKPAAPAKVAVPAPVASVGAEGEITLNSLRDLGRACIKASKNPEMKAALAELGADSLTTMDPSRYAEADAALRAIIAPAAEAPESDGL